MERKILITGGAGFIGSHTAVALHEAGYVPVIVDNFRNSERSAVEGIQAICGKTFALYEGDCTDAAFLDEVFASEPGLAGVIHFAAYKAVNESIRFPVKYYQNNVVSLISLLQAMTEHRVPNLVFSSSCTVYGSPDKIPVTEDSPIKDTPSTYGKTKQLCESILADITSREVRLNAVLLRYFNPVGAHPSGLIGELPIGVPDCLLPYITQSAIGIREKLTVFGDDYDTPDGSCIRDFIHVMDLAKAHIKAFEYLEAHPDCRLEKVNVGTGQGCSVFELIKAFEQVNNQKLNYQIGPRRQGDVPVVFAETTRAKEILGWQAELTVEDAVRDAWNWQQRLQGRADNNGS